MSICQNCGGTGNSDKAGTEEIKPCPSCESEEFGYSNDYSSDEDEEQIFCCDCEMTGPKKATEKDAIDAWNSIPRRSEIYTELCKIYSLPVGAPGVPPLKVLCDKYIPIERKP